MENMFSEKDYNTVGLYLSKHRLQFVLFLWYGQSRQTDGADTAYTSTGFFVDYCAKVCSRYAKV